MTEHKQWVSAVKLLQEAAKKIGFHGHDQNIGVQRHYCAPGYDRRELSIHNVSATQQIGNNRVVYMADYGIEIAVLELKPDTVLNSQNLFEAFKEGKLQYAWHAPNLNEGAWEARAIFSHSPFRIVDITTHGIIKSQRIGQRISELAISIARQRNPFDYSDVTYDLGRADEIRIVFQSWIEERFSVLHKREDLLKQAAELR